MNVLVFIAVLIGGPVEYNTYHTESPEICQELKVQISKRLEDSPSRTVVFLDCVKEGEIY